MPEFTTKYLFVDVKSDEFQKKLDDMTDKGFHPYQDHYVYIGSQEEARVTQLFVNAQFLIPEKKS